MNSEQTTETIDTSLLDLDQRSTASILSLLLRSQRHAVDAVDQASEAIEHAITAALGTLKESQGRLVLVGAGASGRLAVQDGAELWPTYGWPHERLLLCMAGGNEALIKSIEGVEDDAPAAQAQVQEHKINKSDVVLALAASGRSPWTCSWIEAARNEGALTIGVSNNAGAPLLEMAEYPVCLSSGSEVLAGSTRMAAGTAQKVFLNLFSTALMIRLNRTYGNLMTDMAAVNRKLDDRRLRMLCTVLPDLSMGEAEAALTAADGWVKLAALIACGETPESDVALLEKHAGSLRAALSELNSG
ncbi:MAG: N-acetylmuramic acid 6-phosphate etherase [Granulosicoccus sp.]|nr:N-acetylmuramic acid 6-phosphate etherase [Granulosicoccus sp.]